MNCEFIALRLTRHTDRQSILTAYSRQLGRVSLAVPATQGPAARRLRGLVMPLSVAEGVVATRPGRSVLPVSQVRQAMPLPSLRSDPAKQLTAVFLAEVLDKLLADAGADEPLFRFLEESMRVLDRTTGTEALNFHICFMALLTRHLGIDPDLETFRQGRVLDMRAGRWLDSAPADHHDWLDSSESLAAARLAQMTYGNMGRYKYTRPQRARVLNGMLGYYSIHYVSLLTLRSLEILRAFGPDV